MNLQSASNALRRVVEGDERTGKDQKKGLRYFAAKLPADVELAELLGRILGIADALEGYRETEKRSGTPKQ